MNVLVIAPTPFYSNRGTPIRIFEEVKALAALGNYVDVVTYHMGENPDFGDYAHLVTIHRIPRLLFWKKELSAGPHLIKIPLDGVLFFLLVIRMFKKRYQIIHAHHHEGVVLGWTIKKVFFWRRLKLIGDFHGGFTAEMVMHGYGIRSWIVAVLKKIEQMVYSMPDYCITSSVSLMETMHKITSVPTKCVIDCVDVSLLEPRKHIGGSVTIVYTGGFTQDKGIDLLLQVLEYPQLVEKSFVQVVLAGSPLVNIQEKIAHHPLRDRIKMIDSPSPEHLDQLLEQATIALEPKADKGFQSSGKLIRYMAKGLPIVVFDHAVNKNYLGNEYPYVIRCDAASFAQQLVLFIDNSSLCNSAACIAYDRAQLFTQESMRQSLDNIYKELCQ